MKPLTSLFWITCVFLKASCGYNRTDLEYLKDLWLKTTKKSNESLLKQSYGDDYKHLIDTLSRLKTPVNRWNLFQDMRTVIVRNTYEKTFGHKIGMFTNFCGPGDTAGAEQETVCGFFHDVDECCKGHDSCDEFIKSKSDFKEYPNLPEKQLYFTSLSCECDVAFFNCLKRTDSIFGEIILGIYSVAQMSCFQHEYQVAKCTKFDE